MALNSIWKVELIKSRRKKRTKSTSLEVATEKKGKGEL